jgi:thiosulfate reductase cytochrome b subunit
MRRHALVIRVTHWINAAAVVALVVSGVAILLAHPRLYWGETGVVGEPSLLDLPLPFVLTGQTGWGRSLHFLAAWVCVANATVYFFDGVRRTHFSRGFDGYSSAQRTAYRLVVFVLAPVALWTGLAMSPAVTAALPLLARVVGGHQSARTIHFVTASALLVFVLGHVLMVGMTGFRRQMRAMIGGPPDGGHFVA